MCDQNMRKMVKIGTEFIKIETEFIKIRTELVKIRTKLVKIRTELVKIGTELVRIGKNWNRIGKNLTELVKIGIFFQKILKLVQSTNNQNQWRPWHNKFKILIDQEVAMCKVDIKT